MASVKFQFKRGDTFLHQGSVKDTDVPVTVPPTAPLPVDITGWTIKSQVRDPKYGFLSDCTVEYTDPANGEYVLSVPASETEKWPIKELLWDIQYTTAEGQVVSTQTITVDCVKDVTLPTSA